MTNHFPTYVPVAPDTMKWRGLESLASQVISEEVARKRYRQHKKQASQDSQAYIGRHDAGGDDYATTAHSHTIWKRGMREARRAQAYGIELPRALEVLKSRGAQWRENGGTLQFRFPNRSILCWAPGSGTMWWQGVVPDSMKSGARWSELADEAKRQ